MPRQKIQIELRGLRTPRERMWKAMLLLDTGPRGKGRQFTAEEIEYHKEAHPVSRSQVSYFLGSLSAAGIVNATTCAGRRGFAYTLLKRPAEAPNLDRDGNVVKRGNGVQAMWQMAKVLRRFTYARLAEAASQGGLVVKVGTAREYCQILARSGHFRAAGSEPNNMGTPHVVYEVANNTGPHAPAITRERCVFDRNTGTLKPIRTPQEVCDVIA